uniref:Uncharacterized protein n=1 Tax=Heterorhabditis bacteriophora TaxID=37862 RepID=A0A1I7X6N7_HETBA
MGLEAKTTRRIWGRVRLGEKPSQSQHNSGRELGKMRLNLYCDNYKSFYNS